MKNGIVILIRLSRIFGKIYAQNSQTILEIMLHSHIGNHDGT